MPGVQRVVVRPARDDDDLDALNAGCRGWMGAALQRRLFAVPDGLPKGMFVAELDGVPAGYAHTVGHGISDGFRGMAHVYVPVEHRRRGAGRALWQAVLDVCTPDRVRGVMVHADADDSVSLGVAAAHGLRPLGLHLESELDLATFQPQGVLGTSPAAPGVELRPLPPGIDDALWRHTFEVMLRLYRDAPDVAAGTEPMAYEIFRALLPEPWQVMGAWRRERLVGLTAVTVRDRAAGILTTMFTGVERDHRGRGLATALKAAQALAMRDAGWRTVVTQNMQGNDAILASNRRLGFRPSGGRRDLAYDFAAG